MAALNHALLLHKNIIEIFLGCIDAPALLINTIAAKFNF
jgi:hypothetical protein